MPKQSAGILLFRRPNRRLEVFLVHPGGPFFASKDHCVWTIPKGEYTPDEDALAAARREFQEETGFPLDGEFFALDTVRQNSGKVVSAWAVEGDCDPDKLVSNVCPIEWPPRSGKQIVIPEVDRGGWFSIDEARKRMMPAQTPFLDRLVARLGH